MSALPEPARLAPSARQPVRRRWRIGGRPGLWLGVIVVATVLVAALAPWTISRDALREEVTAQLRSSAGLYVFPRGPARLSMLPRPRIQFDDVAFVDPNGALVVEAASMTGDIRLLPLLAGRLEVAEIALATPQMTIDLDRGPMTTAGAAIRAASAPQGSPQAAKADAARLGVVSVTNGTARLRRNGAVVETLSHIDARLDWRSVAAPAALTASLEWNGRPEQLVLWLSTPAALLRGDASPLTLELRDPETNLVAAGTATLASRPQFSGRMRIATKAAPTTLAALGIDVPLPATLREATIDGDIVATPGIATLANLRLDIGGDQFEGALTWQAGSGRPSLTGTLDTSNLTLAPYLGTLPSALGGSLPQTRGQPDLDLRVSAGRLRYERLQADDAALSITSRDGRLELALVDAAAYGGQVKGRVVLAPITEPARGNLQASLLMRGVDWSALDRDFIDQGRLTGTADVSLTLRDEGAGAANGLTGEGTVSLTNGDVAGLDVAGALARLEKRPLAAAGDLGNGRTRFDRATLPFTIGTGSVRVSAGEIVGPTYAIALAGTVGLADGQTAISATVRPSATTVDKAAGFGLEITGPWRRPQFTPDIAGLIRRSNAASPLFPRPANLPAALTEDGAAR